MSDSCVEQVRRCAILAHTSGPPREARREDPYRTVVFLPPLARGRGTSLGANAARVGRKKRRSGAVLATAHQPEGQRLGALVGRILETSRCGLVAEKAQGVPDPFGGGGAVPQFSKKEGNFYVVKPKLVRR